MSYVAPINDMMFVIKELAGLDEVAALPAPWRLTASHELSVPRLDARRDPASDVDAVREVDGGIRAAPRLDALQAVRIDTERGDGGGGGHGTSGSGPGLYRRAVT